jgi:hypothetical protein|tara:strand:+ start:1076 stop:1288 length:213 start_codon:yes stop_codon:yes gene_type:complete
MKKITESKELVVEGFMDFVWKRLIKGKKAGLINAFDNNPTVKKDLDAVDKAIKDLEKSLSDFQKLKNSVK